MGNMSYCRFENTRHDLQDCVDTLYEIESLNELSNIERKNAEEMWDICKTFMERIVELEEEEET